MPSYYFIFFKVLYFIYLLFKILRYLQTQISTDKCLTCAQRDNSAYCILLQSFKTKSLIGFQSSSIYWLKFKCSLKIQAEKNIITVETHHPFNYETTCKLILCIITASYISSVYKLLSILNNNTKACPNEKMP